MGAAPPGDMRGGGRASAAPRRRSRRPSARCRRRQRNGGAAAAPAERRRPVPPGRAGPGRRGVRGGTRAWPAARPTRGSPASGGGVQAPLARGEAITAGRLLLIIYKAQSRRDSLAQPHPLCFLYLFFLLLFNRPGCFGGQGERRPGGDVSPRLGVARGGGDTKGQRRRAERGSPGPARPRPPAAAARPPLRSAGRARR